MDKKQIDDIEIQMLEAGQKIERHSIEEALKQLHVSNKKVITPNHPDFKACQITEDQKSAKN
jgi:hypothetical protein